MCEPEEAKVSDGIRKIAQQLQASAPEKKVRRGKSNRTFPLSEPQCSVFMNYVRSKGSHPSEVLDRLIAAFLKEVEDDLPLDLNSILPDDKPE